MRGREADWQEYTSRQPPPELVDAITAAGFDGIYLDRNGYADPSVENGIAAALGGVTPLVSDNGRFAFFDVRPHRADLVAKLGADGVTRLGNETLYRPRSSTATASRPARSPRPRSSTAPAGTTRSSS